LNEKGKPMPGLDDDSGFVWPGANTNLATPPEEVVVVEEGEELSSDEDEEDDAELDDEGNLIEKKKRKKSNVGAALAKKTKGMQASSLAVPAAHAAASLPVHRPAVVSRMQPLQRSSSSITALTTGAGTDSSAGQPPLLKRKNSVAFTPVTTAAAVLSVGGACKFARTASFGPEAKRMIPTTCTCSSLITTCFGECV
jgi:hypothetical protein